MSGLEADHAATKDGTPADIEIGLPLSLQRTLSVPILTHAAAVAAVRRNSVGTARSGQSCLRLFSFHINQMRHLAEWSSSCSLSNRGPHNSSNSQRSSGVCSQGPVCGGLGAGTSVSYPRSSLLVWLRCSRKTSSSILPAARVPNGDRSHIAGGYARIKIQSHDWLR